MYFPVLPASQEIRAIILCPHFRWGSQGIEVNQLVQSPTDGKRWGFWTRARLASELSLSEPTAGFSQPMVGYVQIFFFFFGRPWINAVGREERSVDFLLAPNSFLLPFSPRRCGQPRLHFPRLQGAPPVCSCNIVQLKRMAEFSNHEEFSCHVCYCTVLSSRLLCEIVTFVTSLRTFRLRIAAAAANMWQL